MSKVICVIYSSFITTCHLTLETYLLYISLKVALLNSETCGINNIVYNFAE